MLQTVCKPLEDVPAHLSWKVFEINIFATARLAAELVGCTRFAANCDFRVERDFHCAIMLEYRIMRIAVDRKVDESYYRCNVRRNGSRVGYYSRT